MRTDGPVVVALDGSLHSAATLRWGLDEAVLRRAPAVLAGVVDRPPGSEAAEWYPTPYRRFDGEAAYLDVLRDRQAARRPGVPLTSRVLRGPEVPALRTLSDDAQLLVVGALGRAGRDPVGRVGAHLAAQAGCPVAVVRDGGRRPAAARGRGDRHRRLPSSRAAAAVAAREAALRGCPLLVVHAGHLSDDRSLRGAGVVDQAVAELRARHPDLDVRGDLVALDPVEALLTRSAAAVLLVVGSRGLGPVRGALLGSVGSRVLHRAAVTVLVVHAGQEGALC